MATPTCTFAMAQQIERVNYRTVPLDGLASLCSASRRRRWGKATGRSVWMLAVASAPVHFDRSEVKWSVKASDLADMAAEGAMGINPDAIDPMYLDNSGHPASNRLAMARASKSHVHALGLSWDDESGKNNGHYAPFAWRSA